MSVCVCTLMHGSPAYAAAGREAVLSVLENSPFDVFAACGDGERPDLPACSRVAVHNLRDVAPTGHRSHRFLRKFQALRACLAAGSHDRVVMLDADAVLARPLSEELVVRALGGADLGMVEQKRIRGSAMDRRAFLDHYTRHTLAFFDSGAAPPDLGDFRYFNAGVVVGTRACWERLVPWALQSVASRGEHQVGEHMIADQDYLQYWANTLHPGSCVELPWQWNHCEWWDERFPRAGALFAHFSNFCNGPASETPVRMRAQRRRRWRPLHRLLGGWHDRRAAKPR